MQPVNRYCRPPAHPTKWTVVVDRPRKARVLTLFDSQAEVHAEIIRLRERGVAHVFALAPLAGDRPTVAALRDPTDMGENEAVGPGSPRSRWRDGHSFRRAPPCNERRPTVLITRGEAILVLFDSRTRRAQIVSVNSETGGKPIDRRSLPQEADADAEML